MMCSNKTIDLFLSPNVPTVMVSRVRPSGSAPNWISTESRWAFDRPDLAGNAVLGRPHHPQMETERRSSGGGVDRPDVQVKLGFEGLAPIRRLLAGGGIMIGGAALPQQTGGDSQGNEHDCVSFHFRILPKAATA